MKERWLCIFSGQWSWGWPGGSDSDPPHRTSFLLNEPVPAVVGPQELPALHEVGQSIRTSLGAGGPVSGDPWALADTRPTVGRVWEWAGKLGEVGDEFCWGPCVLVPW